MCPPPSDFLHGNHTVVSKISICFVYTSDVKYLTGNEKSDSEILKRAFLELFRL
jgi:hypothetical protein